MQEPQGMYDPSARYAFTNISDSEFVSYWDGRPWIVPVGETVEVPEYMAFKMTKELVDRIMIGEVKTAEDDYYKKNPGVAPNTFRAPNSIGVPAAREPLEEKIIRKMDVGEESPQLAIERQRIRAELEEQLQRDSQPGKAQVPASIDEFADLDQSLKQTKAPKAAKAPVPVKKL